VLSLEILKTKPHDPRQSEFAYLFGDLEKLAGSQHDPAVWLTQAAKDPLALPRLFMACGRQDDLLPLNRMFYQASRALQVPVDFHEEDGRHDWFFWNQQIQRFLAAILDCPSPN
jgi:S-formylglutathione hydrolase FrmB